MSRVYAVALVVAATASAGTVLAAELTLANSPVFLTQGVEPNFIMAIDDSGSMDYEVLLPGNDGAAWWRTKNASGGCTAVTGGTFIGCISNGITDLGIWDPDTATFSMRKAAKPAKKGKAKIHRVRYGIGR